MGLSELDLLPVLNDFFNHLTIPMAYLIVGIVTAIGVSFTILHGTYKEKDERRSRDRKIMMDYSDQIIAYTANWQKSKKTLDDGLRLSRAVQIAMDQILFLKKKKMISGDIYEYFNMYINFAGTFLKWEEVTYPDLKKSNKIHLLEYVEDSKNEFTMHLEYLPKELQDFYNQILINKQKSTPV